MDALSSSSRLCRVSRPSLSHSPYSHHDTLHNQSSSCLSKRPLKDPRHSFSVCWFIPIFVVLLCLVSGSSSSTFNSTCISHGPIVGPPPDRPNCAGANCTVWVTSSKEDCPPIGFCYGNLYDALDEAINGQIITILDSVSYMPRSGWLYEHRNITIQGLNQTQLILDGTSPDILVPRLWIERCVDIHIKRITFQGQHTVEPSIVIKESRITFKQFRCIDNQVQLIANGDHVQHIAGCFAAFNSLVRVEQSLFEYNRVHTIKTEDFGRGGACACEDGGHLFVVDSVFDRNVVVSQQAYGGAIYAFQCSVHMINSTVTSTRIQSGSQGFGAAVYVNEGNLDIVSSTFGNNSIWVKEIGAFAIGGAVAVKSAPIYPLYEAFYVSIAGSRFMTNRMRGLGMLEGGAAYLEARSVILNNNHWQGNELNPTKVSRQMNDRAILNNRGGALRIVSHDSVIYDNTFHANSVSSPSGLTPGSAHGGAAEITADSTVYPPNIFQHSQLPRILINSCNWTQNSAFAGDSTEDGTGGAAFGGALKVAGYESNIRIVDNFFVQNLAVGGDAPSSGGAVDGGALYVVQLLLDSDSTNENDAPLIELISNIFAENKALGGTGMMFGGDVTGGSFYFEGPSVLIKNCEFYVNLARGGITTDNTIGSNSGGYARGGAIHVHRHSKSVQFIKTHFSDNIADGGTGTEHSHYKLNPTQYGRGGMAYGGAVSAWMDETSEPVRVSDCTFMRNFANGGRAQLTAGQGYGGALWAYNTTVLQKTRFGDNRAQAGGAIYAVFLHGHLATFDRNRVEAAAGQDAYGGAVFAYYAVLTLSEFKLNKVITTYSSGDAKGGAIHSESLLDLRSCRFISNSVNSSYTRALGGAVSVTHQTFMTSCDFAFNIATTLDASTDRGPGEALGGSIYLDLHNVTSSLTKIAIDHSEASYGGGFYARGPFMNKLKLREITTTNNKAKVAGGGFAYLPSTDKGFLNVDRFCTGCDFTDNNNTAVHYGADLIMPYKDVIGLTTSNINPGLPFQANFSVVDYAANLVRADDLQQVLTYKRGLLFQSGAAQDRQLMTIRNGKISWSDMTAWGNPGENFTLSFRLSNYLPDFGPVDGISVYIPYQLAKCPPGYRLDATSSYVTCQLCLSGLYGFGSGCSSCPDEYGSPCIQSGEDQCPTRYTVAAGFFPSPRVNPTSILQCPFAVGYIDGRPMSSCLASVCDTDCGKSRALRNLPDGQKPNFTAPLCKTECANHSCTTGHTGFLCSECICNAETCFYSDEGCHECHNNWMPTAIIVGIAVSLFVLLKGSVLVVIFALLFVAVVFLMFFDLITSLIPGIMATAFIIFVEAQRSSSSGLIKSFVFFLQTVSVFISPQSWPSQLAPLVQLRGLVQFRMVGLECLNFELFGEPFKRFVLSMILPLALLLIVVLLYWFCELLRLVNCLRALQDFDPFEKIPYFRSRLQANRKLLAQEYSLLKDTVVSEPDLSVSMNVNASYLSDGALSDSSDSSSFADPSPSSMPCRLYVRHMNYKLGRVAIFIVFAVHFELCNRVFEVFAPCISVPSESFSYLSTYPWVVCTSATISYFTPYSEHGRMVIAGLFFMIIYVAGIPLFFSWLLFSNRRNIKAGDPSISQWMGLLYNSYRPSMLFFEIVWLVRRVTLAAAISVIPHGLVSHYLIPAIILFLSIIVQRRYKPFIAKEDNNMEVMALLCIIFAISCNVLIASRPIAADLFFWRWLSFLVVSATCLAYLYKLIVKPLVSFLKPPKED